MQDDREPKPAPEARSVRATRSDALRNEDSLLEAAKIIFVSAGVDAPVRDIAAKAGVGIGTLYRRFPKRSDLVAAVFRREVDACVADAKVLAAAHPPGDALWHWLNRYTAFLATKKGLAAALFSGDPAFDALPAYFRERFEPCLAALLDAAASAGVIRADVAPYDLLRAIGNLAASTGDDAQRHTQDMVRLLFDGLRYGAASKA